MKAHRFRIPAALLLCCALLVTTLTACNKKPTEPTPISDENNFVAPDVRPPFGEDKTETATDVNEAINALYQLCHEQPEVLAATMSAFPSQLDELELEEITPNTLDDALDGENGGEVQRILLEKLKALLEDPTIGIMFSNWDGRAKMLYMAKRDENADVTPANMTLLWEYVQLDGDTVMAISVPRADGAADFGYFDMRYGFQRFEPVIVPTDTTQESHTVTNPNAEPNATTSYIPLKPQLPSDDASTDAENATDSADAVNDATDDAG